MLVIGLVGKMCAGKDEIASILMKKGFEGHSLSDALREELDRRGLERTRQNLREVGNELRSTEGPQVLAERMKRMIEGDRVVLVSIRNPAEVASLRELDRFVLVGVDAPAEIRFERELRRGREDPPDSFQEFLYREELENSADPTGQQLDATFALADEIIKNVGTREELKREVEDMLKKVTADG